MAAVVVSLIELAQRALAGGYLYRPYTTHQVNRDEVFSVSCVRFSWSVAYDLLAVEHRIWHDTRGKARSETALVKNIL